MYRRAVIYAYDNAAVGGDIMNLHERPISPGGGVIGRDWELRIATNDQLEPTETHGMCITR